MATYELWEMRSGNLVGSWAAEADALAVIRTALDTHGDETVATMSLLAEDARGVTNVVAEGPALIERARQRTPSQDKLSA